MPVFRSPLGPCLIGRLSLWALVAREPVRSAAGESTPRPTRSPALTLTDRLIFRTVRKFLSLLFGVTVSDHLRGSQIKIRMQ
jgi:hypothetical protein